MHIRRQASVRPRTALALIGVTLLVTACGSSNTSTASTTNSGAGSPAGYAGYGGSAGSTTTSSGTVKIATAHGSAGTYLVGPSGRALYIWAADKNGTSSCSGSCAKAWPPLTTTGSPQAGNGAMAADLNTTKRADGTLQVMYKGHPLYYFVADGGPGTTKGQGSNSFGAKWWLLAPSGTPITTGASSSSSSSSGGGGGWG